jgi:hypothetical protein
MGIEILISIVAGALSLVGGGLISSELLQKLVRRVLRLETKYEAETYHDKLSRLLKSLSDASSDVDAVLGELAAVARHRQESVQKLESDLKSLETREQQLQKVIKDLEGVPIPVAEHIAAIATAGEKRSAKRDYILFGLGVFVSTIIAIILHIVGVG